MKFELQPKNDEGPVFKEPWEAHAFALVLALHEQEVFSWPEWADALSQEISAAQTTGDLDLGDTYYQHWLCALERLVIEKNHADAHEISTRISEWRNAYLTTPHGKPVELPTSKRLSDCQADSCLSEDFLTHKFQ